MADKAKVTVYSTPTCPWCEKTKEFLTEKSVKFENVDVVENPEKGREMVEKSGQMGVPVTIINKDGKETVIIGFDKEKISKTLGIAA